jgi:hypothetical protein
MMLENRIKSELLGKQWSAACGRAGGRDRMFREYCWRSLAASIRMAAISASFPSEIISVWDSMDISVLGC